MTETAEVLRRSRQARDSDAHRAAAVEAALRPWAEQKRKYSRVEIGAALVAGRHPDDIGANNLYLRDIATWLDGRLARDIADQLHSLRVTGAVTVYRTRRSVAEEARTAERARLRQEREDAKAHRDEARRAASARHLAKTIAWLESKGYRVEKPVTREERLREVWRAFQRDLDDQERRDGWR